MGRMLDKLKKRMLLKLHEIFSKKQKIDLAEFKPRNSFFARFNPISRLIADPRGQLLWQAAMVGPMLFEVLRTATGLGLFEILNQKPGMRLEEIAEKLKLDVYPVKVLMLGLVPMQLVFKIGDEYFNNPLSAALFSEKTNDGFFLKNLEYLHHIVNPAVYHLRESVLQNKPVGLTKLFREKAENSYLELSRNEEKNQYFEPFMRLFSQRNRDRVASMADFSTFSRILDVGGNTGDLMMAIARHHPSVKATVFDFPGVVEATAKRFQEYDLADRLDTFGGNILESPFPSGYDCVMFAHFVDIFPEETNRSFLRKAFSSMEAGGRVCVFTPIIDDTEDGSLINCLCGTYFLCLANGQGQFYSPEAIQSWMKDEGFVEIECRFLPLNEAVFFGKKP